MPAVEAVLKTGKEDGQHHRRRDGIHIGHRLPNAARDHDRDRDRREHRTQADEEGHPERAQHEHVKGRVCIIKHVQTQLAGLVGVEVVEMRIEYLREHRPVDGLTTARHQQ